MKPQAVVLDFDGTLVHLPVEWNQLKNELSSYLWNKHKLQIDFGHMSPALYALRDNRGEKGLSEAYQIITRYEEAALAHLEPKRSVVQFVKSLAGDTRSFAVFSNNMASTIRTALIKLELDSQVKIVVGRENVTRYKPDCEGLQKILADLVLDPEEMVFIGDSAVDKCAAKGAGVRFQWVTEISKSIGLLGVPCRADSKSRKG